MSTKLELQTLIKTYCGFPVAFFFVIMRKLMNIHILNFENFDKNKNKTFVYFKLKVKANCRDFNEFS